MARHWTEVKSQIEAELDKIMWEEPLEVKMSRLGVYPSGAGTANVYFANLLFQLCETQAMSWANVTPALTAALRDPDFDVVQVKKLFSFIVTPKAKLLGEVAPPKCPYPWLNLRIVEELALAIEEAFPTVADKEDLTSLLWSWFGFIERQSRWWFLAFPWELGAHLKNKTPDQVAELVREGELPSEVLDWVLEAEEARAVSSVS
ncbi:MAG: hypothetical protein LBS27_08525 [Bifidobacteriaceae bacterium]|jgi:hypothetical protein|nr:hypothetical protein [Bifidobacteriaceae bacterium]